MNVFDKIRAGTYKNELPYPSMSQFLNREGYNEGMKTYHEETWRLEAQLRADLEQEFGTAGNPKADKLWGKAWEHGHSGGYSEVANCYSDLYELIV